MRATYRHAQSITPHTDTHNRHEETNKTRTRRRSNRVSKHTGKTASKICTCTFSFWFNPR